MRYVILFLAITFSGVVSAQTGKKFLVVVAHPDDESALAEVLVKYRKMGNKIHLVIATDGKDGTRVTKIPAGDSLGNLRKMESRCACEKLGIDPPIFLGIDRLDTRHGVGKYFDSHRKLLLALKETISKIQPDFILTFGPDGDTHHAEHIVIGSAVTELLLMEGWVERYPLYYVAWTREQGALLDLGYLHANYFNVRIDYTQEDENDALTIMPCYQTQFTAEELEQDRTKKLNDQSNWLHFRRLATAKGMSNTFKK